MFVYLGGPLISQFNSPAFSCPTFCTLKILNFNRMGFLCFNFTQKKLDFLIISEKHINPGYKRQKVGD